MSKHSIMFINLLDPLHNGAGQGVGAIDRPIIRETATLYPLIQPSSVKGPLRHRFAEVWRDPPDRYRVLALFGPDAGDGAERHSGAISFGEGQLLAFPVRSLKGLFVWATSPRILFRLQQRVEIAGTNGLNLKALLEKVSEWGDFPQVRYCQGPESSILVGDTRQIVLEEFAYPVLPSLELSEFAKKLSAEVFGAGSYWAGEFSKKLVILPEDSFRYFVTNATEVMPNIRIGESGTTEKGSLRYTEYLPREAILYSLITYEKARIPEKWGDGEDDMKEQFQQLNTDESVRDAFEGARPSMIQFGGDETTGKGLSQLKILKGG